VFSLTIVEILIRQLLQIDVFLASPVLLKPTGTSDMREAADFVYSFVHSSIKKVILTNILISSQGMLCCNLKGAIIQKNSFGKVLEMFYI
jgi:hypothetical protein